MTGNNAAKVREFRIIAAVTDNSLPFFIDMMKKSPDVITIEEADHWVRA